MSLCMVQAQETAPTVPLIDVVWLKDGSRLSGSILRWDLDRGLELKLASGAVMSIPKKDIRHVFQQVQQGTEDSLVPIATLHRDQPYAFKEHGLYHTASAFFHVSEFGGIGVQYSIGHRFNHRFGVGMGIGYESNEINAGRNLMPIFGELRGYLLQKKFSPYYALKVGHSIAFDNEEEFQETGKGGVYFAPEIGMRFGSSKINFYLGAEYKYQQATYEVSWLDYSYADKITYKRLEVRTGIVF